MAAVKPLLPRHPLSQPPRPTPARPRCSAIPPPHAPRPTSRAPSLPRSLSLRAPGHRQGCPIRASYGGSQPPPPSQYYFNPSGAAASSPPYYEGEGPEEEARRAQASKRVERTSRYFRRLGVVGFWSQLACSIVSAVILSFSIIITGKPSAPVATYLTFAGIVMAFVSVFWSFGYLRLADRLKFAADNPIKAPPRAAVVANLKNGLIVNLLGMTATLIGLQATVGLLVAKALTSSTPMYGAVGTPPGFNPVLALDVFLVQASGNTALSHFIGMVLSLELLRSTTQSTPPPDASLPRPA